MNYLKKSIRFFSYIFFFLVNFLIVSPLQAQDGKALFSQNCASCHAVHKKLTGPALNGIENRWTDKAKLYSWIKNSAAFLKTGDKYANDLYIEYNKTAMNLFPNLTDKEIDAILAYIKTVPAPGSNVGNSNAANANTQEDNNANDLVFGILAILLAVIVLILLQVNSNLKKLTDEKEGNDSPEPVPFYKNKVYIAALVIILFLIGGYFLTKSAIGLGREKNYQPEQPIFYSHKVHAGINQINCQYCHVGVYQGKQALIPSVNICMNCHLAINEYKGQPLVNSEGKQIDGTAEIKKLYKYAGFEEGKPWDESKAKPIEWVRIHNLPDHVYFNHSQHVKVGKQECQNCHGEIQKMDEVKQFAELSMGWCVNCHRSTAVQFKDNGFYSIYKSYHEQLKHGKMDSTTGITVEKIGGTECQKCHY